MARFFLGIDVGTGSARAGVFDEHGKLLGSAKRSISIWHEPGSVVEQSSEQIWQAVCDSVKDAVASVGVAIAAIVGIGFDATCSLVAVKSDGTPVTVSVSGDINRNIIVWMDHRAAGEAEEINAGGYDVLKYVGGRISPEMETPKLLWLKRHLPESFAATDHFFDLADYLTWRSTGSLSRSVCTVTCKWTYLAHEQHWDSQYFRAIGLEELVAEGFSRIGTDIVAPGTALAAGLTEKAASELGLNPGTAVGAGLIDAHAGGVGTLGAIEAGNQPDICNRLAYVFGTSACSMASSSKPIFIDGVWGPYCSAMVPGLWLLEGGQSAAGAAIDHLVMMHPASSEATAKAEAAGLSRVAWLDRMATELSPDLSHSVELANSIHVVPEFLGNRSPFADPDARAVISGLGLETDLSNLVSLYIAGLCGIGYGLRQLLNTLRHEGIQIGMIVASGGAAQSDLVRQLLADATNLPVAVPETQEPVLLGAAMLAATAAGTYSSLPVAMKAMSNLSEMVMPTEGEMAVQHQLRYRAFEMLQTADRNIRRLMEDSERGAM